MNGIPPAKPIPVPIEADRPYWDGLAERRLVLSRCDGCGSYTQRAQMICSQCLGESFTWTEVSGRGAIYSYTVARQTWVSCFERQLPYVVVAVAIEEQPSLILTTNLVGDIDIEALELGLPVVADYEQRGPRTLLQFRLEG